MGTMALKVVELRQYTLHPGQRVALFDGALVRPQEALGMTSLASSATSSGRSASSGCVALRAWMRGSGR